MADAGAKIEPVLFVPPWLYRHLQEAGYDMRRYVEVQHISPPRQIPGFTSGPAVRFKNGYPHA